MLHFQTYLGHVPVAIHSGSMLEAILSILPKLSKDSFDLQKVVVHIRYKLATDLSNGRREALDLLGEKVVGQAIVNSFRMKSGAQRKKYFSCRVLIYI